MKTFIKWQGNKSRYINKIIPYFPKDFDTYIEPFAGSGAILLKIEPEKFIVNDINKDLIGVYELVRDEPETLIQFFKEFDCSDFKTLGNSDKKSRCKELTSTISKLPFGHDRAKIYLLMKYCVFMGNLLNKGEFFFRGLELHISVQNKYFFLRECYYENIRMASTFLKKGVVSNTDYKNVLTNAKKGDFIFLDPPYFESHDYQLTYNKDEDITLLFLEELLEQLSSLDSKGVKWLMTQADTPEVRQIFKDYTVITFEVYRSYNKVRKNELIIKNYE